MATISKEKLCSVISDVFDKSKDIIIDADDDTLDYDAVELTLMLKSIGFRLKTLEFDGIKNDESNEIEIDIRCRRSGILSKLSMKGKKCTCPSRKATNNNSFWEIQGTGPSTPVAKQKAIVQDTSCNLLPDITRKTASVAKAMLTILLDRYLEDFSPKEDKPKTEVNVKTVMERMHMKGKLNEKLFEDNLKEMISPGDAASSDQNVHCSTPLSSINVTPVPSYNGPIVSVVPKIILSSAAEGHNTTEEESNLDSEKPPEELSQIQSMEAAKDEVLLQTPTDTEQASEKLNTDNERDICLIKSITDARKQLDAALLLLKCNVTRDISHSSILTVTPQSLKILPKSSPTSPAKRNGLQPVNRRLSGGSIEANRRHSTGGAKYDGKALLSPRKLKSIGELKKKSLGSMVDRFQKPDTPRPEAKKNQDKNNSTYNGKMPIKRTSTGTNLKTSLVKTQITKSASKLNSTNTAKK